jgi:hypothetical protein
MGQTPSTRWLSSDSLPSLAKPDLHSKSDLLSKLDIHSTPLAVDSATLFKLPPELLIRIASFLPPISAGAFTLCNKRLYTLLAIPYLRCPRGHPAFNKAEFLKLLEPSLPNHIVCYHCERLHDIRHPERHVKYDSRCDITVNEPMRTYIHPRFSHVIFQMAMKRHRQGLDTSSLLKLLSYEDSRYYDSIRTTASCRIVDGSLLLRQQHTFIVHPSSEPFFSAYMRANICPHTKELRSKVRYEALGTARYSMVYSPGSVDVDHTPTLVECDCCSYRGLKDEGNWSGLVRCRACATEFRIDTMAVGRDGKAFVVTLWKDLGEGRDGGDVLWRAHMGEEGLVGGAGERGEGVRSVCARFEGKGWQGGMESLVAEKERKRVANFKCRY